MLARRELSEAQVRQRLAQRGHTEDAIAAAVARLREERAIDDRRVADAMARHESSAGRRSKRGAQRHIEEAGIAGSIARGATDDAYGELDGDALLEASIAKRLRGRTKVADDREFQRVYRYLVAHGFEPDQVIRALRARSVK